MYHNELKPELNVSQNMLTKLDAVFSRHLELNLLDAFKRQAELI